MHNAKCTTVDVLGPTPAQTAGCILVDATAALLQIHIHGQHVAGATVGELLFGC